MALLATLTDAARSGSLDATTRAKVTALVTTELHNRDVLAMLLAGRWVVVVVDVAVVVVVEVVVEEVIQFVQCCRLDSTTGDML